MTTNRQDIHSPTNMDPADYEYTFAYDSGAGGLVGLLSTDEGRAFWNEITSNLARVHPSMNQCDHCGAWLRYVAVLKHIPSGKFITVGEQCLDGRFSLQSKTEFDTLRKNAALDRKAQRIRGMVVDRLNDLAATQPAAVVDFLADKAGENDPAGMWSAPADIRRKFHLYGEISDRQVALVAKVLAEQVEKAARRAAEADEPKAPVPTGTVTVEGEVLTTKWQDSDYGSTLKMLVKADAGWKVWGTVPSKIRVERGDRVRFTCSVEASNDDPSFGFFKRPRQAEVIFEANPAPAPAPEAPVPFPGWSGYADGAMPEPVQLPLASPAPAPEPGEGACRTCATGAHVACDAQWGGLADCRCAVCHPQANGEAA